MYQDPVLRSRGLEPKTLLGKGAYADVYQVRGDGVNYALKVINKKKLLMSGRDIDERTEVCIYKTLGESTRIACLRDEFSDEQDLGFRYILLDLYPTDLTRTLCRLPGQRCDSQDARRYCTDIVEALRVLRAHSVAHRDLKPDNLLVDSDGQLRLCDFDCAVLVDPEYGSSARLCNCWGRSTDASARPGTLDYAPPEVLRRADRNAEAFSVDLWAFGCIIFRMLVGRTPFHAATSDELERRILSRRYQFPQDFHPEEVCWLVGMLLRRVPRRRLGACRVGGIDELQQGIARGFDQSLSLPGRLSRLTCQLRSYGLKETMASCAASTPTNLSSHAPLFDSSTGHLLTPRKGIT